MTHSEIPEQYRERYDQLITLRRQMQSQIGILEQSLESNKQPGEELADIGSDNFTQITNINILNTEELELDMIDDAIEKMYAGTYGICEDCGKAIEPARLEAKPFAKLCLKHKELREQEELGIDVTYRR